MNYIYQPIDKWPREFTKSRRRAVFKSTYEDSLAKLGNELEKIGAREMIVMAAFREDDIRQDGLPRSNARQPSHPGIIIAAKTKFGPMKWVCDEFTDWRFNVRAIALTLERLRLADLYGVTKRGEQYTGWRQIEGPKAMDRKEAEDFINSFGGEKEALMATHPDKGGDVSVFQRVQEARKIIGNR